MSARFRCAVTLLALALLLLLTAGEASAAHETGEFVRTAPKGATYSLIVPGNYDRKKGATLLFWLYGAGDRHANAARGLKSYRFKPDWILVVPNARASGAWQMGEMDRVLDVLEEVGKQYTIRRSFLGGFSRGAFFVYVFGLTHADKFAGFLSVSGGLPNVDFVKQGDADKYPVAIVHGEADTVVAFSRGTQARDTFRKAGWKEKLFFRSVPGLGHRVDRAATQAALDWLDKTAQVFSKPKDRYDYAVKSHDRGEPNRAYRALSRLDEAKSGKEPWWKEALALKRAIEKQSEKTGKKLKRAIHADRNPKWLPDWKAYDAAYEGTPFHAEVVEEHKARVAAHNQGADARLADAQAARGAADPKAAIKACLAIRDKCYAADSESVGEAKRMLAVYRGEPATEKKYRRLLKGTASWN